MVGAAFLNHEQLRVNSAVSSAETNLPPFLGQVSQRLKQAQ
jgi:hypothetical protein